MEARRWTEARALFEQLCDLPAGERETELARRAQDDEELGRLVRELLRLDAGAEALDFLVPGEVRANSLAAAPEALEGEPIGPFRVLRQIGTGGMGVVYEAEQDSPRRRVALKVLRPELATGSLMRRFQVEAEILAALRHDGIARVLASGTSVRGEGPLKIELHWQALELLEGARTILEHAQQQDLDPQQCVRLVAQVARAVQHAHERGVIHRDLKPSNVLVDAGGQPKVIDFGVARASFLQSESLKTSPGELLGTLRYMAPEQLEGDPNQVDVRVDVYALGVILYELLCGRAPVESQGQSYSAILTTLREGEPLHPRSLRPRLALELCWILLAAVEREPARRYDSAAALAADLERFLAGEAVSAGAPSRVYRLRKRLWKSRYALAAGVVILSSLSAGLVSSQRGMRLAQSAEARTALALASESEARLAAELEAMKSTNVVELVQFALDDARRTGGTRDLRVSDLFRSVSAVLGAHNMLPFVEASVRNTVARFQLSVGNLPEGLREAERAHAVLERSGEGNSEEAAAALALLGQAQMSLGRFVEARHSVERAVELLSSSTRAYPIELFQARHRSIDIAMVLGEFERAESELDLLRAEIESTYGAESENAHVLRGTGALLGIRQGRLELAQAEIQSQLARARALEPNGGSRTWRALELQSRLQLARGRASEALDSIREAIEILNRTGPARTLNHARTGAKLARALLDSGDPAAAEAAANETLAILREQGAAGVELFNALQVLAEVRLSEGDTAGAKVFLDEAVERVVAGLPPEAPARVQIATILARCGAEPPAAAPADGAED